MNVFPQLTSGSIVQYPLQAQRRVRTVVTRSADGYRTTFPDPLVQESSWQVHLDALSDTEWVALENLFATSEGRLATFLFVDPTDNMLLHSENFSNSVWSKAPGIVIGLAVAGPLVGANATAVSNSSASLQRISQTLVAPGTYRYTFSVWARSVAENQMRLIVQSGNSYAEQLYAPGANWSRLVLPVILSSEEDTADVILELASSSSFEIFGAQLEAQPAPSTYKKTTTNAGVYQDARFAEDTLVQLTTEPGQHRSVIRIVTRVGS